MISISNLTHFQINEDDLRNLAKEILKLEGRENDNLSLVIVGPRRIKFLNNRYRKRNRVTTVLSFPLSEEGLGEIFLCPRRIKKEAKRKNVPFSEEFTKILIHGILNLTRKSEEEREKMEEVYFQKLKEWLKI